MREQDLLFSDFSDEPCDLEEGVEYNKVSNETKSALTVSAVILYILLLSCRHHSFAKFVYMYC